jgi:3-methyladenine DNA glycosylase/8-oxoguanine DNA glycosylase
MLFNLTAKPPFNFQSTIHSHGWYQLPPFEWGADSLTLRKTELLDSGRVALLTFRGDGDDGDNDGDNDGDGNSGITVEAKGRFSKRELAEIERKAAWMFMLDADFSEFYDQADREPRLAHCRDKAHGRQLRSSTLWEDVCKVMMTTNIQWGGTKRLVKSLVDHFGDPLDGDPSRHAFPTAERIARSRESTLRKLGLGYRSPYLLKLARGVVSGEYNLDSLVDPSLTTDELKRKLIDLPGIGPYAANTLLMFLRRYDHIGVDTEAVSLVSKHFYSGRPVGEKEINDAFAKWGKYKSLAYWFWDYAGMQQAPMEAWEAKQPGAPAQV